MHKFHSFFIKKHLFFIYWQSPLIKKKAKHCIKLLTDVYHHKEVWRKVFSSHCIMHSRKKFQYLRLKCRGINLPVPWWTVFAILPAWLAAVHSLTAVWVVARVSQLLYGVALSKVLLCGGLEGLRAAAWTADCIHDQLVKRIAIYLFIYFPPNDQNPLSSSPIISPLIMII